MGKIGYQNFIYLPLKETGSGFEIIGSAVLITLFLERALEVIMNLWREPNKIEYKSQLKEVQIKIDRIDNQIITVKNEIDKSSELEFIEKQNKLIDLKQNDKKEQESILSKINLRLDDYRAISQQYAHIISFGIGIFICLAGFGVLNEVFDYEVLQSQTLELNDNAKKVTAAVISFQNADSLLSAIPLTDTFKYKDKNGNELAFVNPIQNIQDNQKEFKDLLENETVVLSFKQESASQQQQSLFMILNLLITALLLSGRTEGMHKLASVYLSFLSKTKNEFELPKQEKN